MLASGNGDVQACVMNLLRTVRGEVPYARTKGIGREHIDAPSTESSAIRADAEWVIETYEPRVGAAGVEAFAEDAACGDFGIRAGIGQEG